MICDGFKGGYCDIVKMHVPKSWCKNVCNQRWPDKIELAKNFSTALVKRSQRIENRNPEEQQSIMAICLQCDRYEEIKGKPRCRHIKCGCFLKTKIKWITEHCPEAKW